MIHKNIVRQGKTIVPDKNLPELDPWTHRDPAIYVYHPLWEAMSNKVVEVLEVAFEQVTPGSHIADDLGADSLDLVELVEALEADFGIQIDDEELRDVATVGEAYTLISSKLESSP